MILCMGNWLFSEGAASFFGSTMGDYRSANVGVFHLLWKLY